MVTRADLAARALTAFAAPIEQHAREYAAAVLESIRLDVRQGASRSVAEDAATVDAAEEWLKAGLQLSADMHEQRRRYPAGANEWVECVWCETFTEEFEALADEHRQQTRARGVALITDYVGRNC
jgi:lipid-binding SYLF domain-containing protein